MDAADTLFQNLLRAVSVEGAQRVESAAKPQRPLFPIAPSLLCMQVIDRNTVSFTEKCLPDHFPLTWSQSLPVSLLPPLMSITLKCTEHS